MNVKCCLILQRRIHYRFTAAAKQISGTQAYLDMELSDVMSFGERIALKLRFGWDTAEEDEHRQTLQPCT